MGRESREVEIYKKQEGGLVHMTRLSGFANCLWTLAPTLLERLGDRDPIFKCWLTQMVNSFVSSEFSQVGTSKENGSSQGHSLELLEMMPEFVQVS